MRLTDGHGRKINYLRLSLTDRCNLRCSYCMPATGVLKRNHGDVLSYEQLLLLARAGVSLGIEKIRVTGGEPLVRKGILPFLRQLAELPGLRQLVLTTNGVLLPELAADLKACGVQRLNISLDSLRPEVFADITRRDALARVLAGIDAAEETGMPVKINMVVMRGVNDRELLDFAALTLDRPRSVRFIEYMPARQQDDWQSLVVSGDEILARLGTKYHFTPIIRGELAGPAREFRIDGAQGNIGVITALSGHFCQDCNRIRITSEGKVRTCLFGDEDYDLRPLLAGGDEEQVRRVLRQMVEQKPERHGMDRQHADHAPFTMASIGG